jgi:predicted nucleotide-binding protein/phosphoserine phosphatase
MSVGLFLDVDNTLTKGYIQETFARLLGCHSGYKEIENDFQTQAIESDEFGERLIALFNGAGFTQDYATDHFSDIKLHGWTPKLFALSNVDVYLVSSGPNYYVQGLAKKFGVPESRVHCSEYTFENGKLSDCLASSSTSKKEFVRVNREKYALTIGIGDNPTHDGPFVTACDIAVLTEPHQGFLYAESLENIVTLVSKLAKPQVSVPRTTPTLFIGSASERISVANSLFSHLERVCHPSVWTYGIFKASTTNVESLELSLSNFDFAAFIATSDDLTTSRGNTLPTVRDNIIFEFGLFMGRIGRNRCFLLHPRNGKPTLPSDLDGLICLEYAADNPDQEAALTTAAVEIKKSINHLGCRGYRL